jgi:hypothetical protein
MRSKPIAGRQLGYSESDRAKPFAKYWNPVMRPLPAHAVDALHRGAVAEPLIPGVEQAQETLFGGKPVIETGYALHANGAMHVNILTDMPGVSPEMVDWWFAWHGDDAAKYKLWHPQSHVHAQWVQPQPETGEWRSRYVGNTSFVDEYLGSELSRLSIRFVLPQELELHHPSLDDPKEATAICARGGLGERPVDAGWLVHHVRRTATGSEMRSRFWIGGPYAAPRQPGVLARLTAQAAKLFARPTDIDARNLLVHCAQEMQHLAGFLPAIYEEFRNDR